MQQLQQSIHSHSDNFFLMVQDQHPNDLTCVLQFVLLLHDLLQHSVKSMIVCLLTVLEAGSGFYMLFFNIINIDGVYMYICSEVSCLTICYGMNSSSFSVMNRVLSGITAMFSLHSHKAFPLTIFV